MSKELSRVAKAPMSRKLPFKLSVKTWGQEGIVTMTEEQYGELLSLVGRETLDNYIERLEGMLLSLKGGVYPHSHYRTLKAWLTEDFSV